MAHVVDMHDVPHEQLQEEDEVEIELGTTTRNPVQEFAANNNPRSPQGRAAIPTIDLTSSSLGSSRRIKLVATLFTVLAVVAVTIGIVASRGAKTTGTTEVSVEADPDVTPMAAEPMPFLKLTFQDDGTAVFVLNKAHWNSSFVVYPTVIKHSSPPHAGMEHGSVMLDTSHYVFHFERSLDKRFLLLVCENHLTRLKSEEDELKQVFEESQWPGYFTRVTIYMEDEEAFHFPTEPFFAHGFYVSVALMTPYYSAIRGGSAFYPRNSNFQVEYELDDGIVQVNFAVGLLPETPMAQRVADDRVGYFMQRYMRYGVENNDPKNATAEGRQYMDAAMTVINRRRLELDPTTGKTKEPIVYYIDPSVPERWRDAFVEGVIAWVLAFEAIGFEDAIRAVKPGDADWPIDYRIGDLRYNSISVMISDETYAYGPIVFDPRSGEILHSDIIFEYGFFDEVVADFDLRSPAGPPSASGSMQRNSSKSSRFSPHQCGIGNSPHHQHDRAMVGMLLGSTVGIVPDAVIARHFTDIIMHEVGHTLGLRHNFAGSALVSRQDLADAAFTSANGLSSSIMDYVAVNIFSDLTPSAATTHDFYQTVIGKYDMAAIAYGYSIVAGEAPGYKHETLSKIAQNTPLFLTDEDADKWTNPYAQRFDISSDPIDYANDRLELVKVLRSTSLADKVVEDASWSDLWRYERTLLRIVNTSILAVQPFLGGVNATHAHRKPGETSFSVPFIPQETQLRALGMLSRIIRADDGLFPEPSEYAAYIQVKGYEGEDCAGPSNDYGCLARALVDVDAYIKSIREFAVIAALFPALDRIVAQDVNSPLSVKQLLNAVGTAAASNPQIPRNRVINTFFYDVLVQIMKDEDEDSRLRREVKAFLNATISS